MTTQIKITCPKCGQTYLKNIFTDASKWCEQCKDEYRTYTTMKDTRLREETTNGTNS